MALESIADPPEYPTTERSIVDVPQMVSFGGRFLAFCGPAFLVSVGYMDPGNWATDIEGGSRFGYRLLWVILASNLMAILLQVLATRLGLATGMDLAQACRRRFRRPVSNALWLLCEVAIAACDLAEVIGSAIAINLLFHIPLLLAVILTAFDVLLLLCLQSVGIRWLESFIIALIGTISACFLLELFLARPHGSSIAHGLLVPALPNHEALYVALGIVGATVMPHNLYLHSALVKSRRFERTPDSIRSAAKFNLLDTLLALTVAFLVNAAILIMAAAVFHKHGKIVTEIQQAHETLRPLLGTALAPMAFAVALLASGQSSTITGTLAGQVVMEGFLDIRVAPWLRRLITRLIAIVPAVIVVALYGNRGTYQLLILSQVVLSVQLSFATVPLVMFTSDRQMMGEFANGRWWATLAWAVTLAIAGLNLYLLYTSVSPRVLWTVALAAPAFGIGVNHRELMATGRRLARRLW